MSESESVDESRWLKSALAAVRGRPRLAKGIAVLVVLALLAAGVSVTRAIRSDEQAGPWTTPLWANWTSASIGDACTVGLCVGDTVALPLGRPVEAVADLSMPEELGALTIERAWIGEGEGLFGRGWATVWDVQLVDGKFVGPLPAKPVEAPRRGHRVSLEGGASVRVDDQGRLDEVCPDPAACTEAEWSDDTLVLRPVLASAEGEDAGELPQVTLSLDEGLVSRAKAIDGRSIDYRYEGGQLASVTRGEDQTTYGYEADRLASIDDGVRRTYSYDGAGRVVAATDLDGRSWTISPIATDGGGSEEPAATGQAIEVRSPEGWTRTFRFDSGSLAEVVDSELGVLLRRGTADGQVTVEERPLEGVRYEWVADDQLRVDQQPAGGTRRSARYWFDDAARVVRTETPEGTSRVSYEGASRRPAEVRGPNGTQRFDYDRNGLLVATEDADGYQVKVQRNALGQPVVITDGVQRTEFAYDAAGRVNQQRSGDSESSANYWANGELAWLKSPAGDQLDAIYDDHGRLKSLGDAATEPADVTEPDEPAPPGEPDELDSGIETVARSDGGFEQRYPSGETVVLDDGGRPVEVTVGGRTESRRYDDSGRLVELDVPGGPSYELDYTRAGRVASISDGAVAADLEWHGDLLTAIETSAGSNYEFTYDEAGRVASATEGPLRWDYTYDDAGRSSVVQGPFGVLQSRWDERGRPVEVRDSGRTERYRWAGDDLDLDRVEVDGEEQFRFARNEAGQIVEVTEADSGTAELGYDPVSGAINRYRIGDAELNLDYDSEGHVVAIESGDRTETWTWVDGKVVEVEVNGENDPYQLEWLAPGLMGDVKQGDDHLLRTEADSTGRPTEFWTGDDQAAALSWDDTGLAKAAIDGDPDVTLKRDDEHRLVRVEVGDDRVDWTYEDGALTRIEEGDRDTTFEYLEGRLDRTIHDDGDDESTITWDRSRARPDTIVTPDREANFAYEDGKVTSIQIDDNDEQVRYEDGQPSAGGAAGDILDALFSDAGRYSGASGQSMVGPSAPWVESLPDGLGVTLPEVITGRQVAETAIDNQLPKVPGFLVDDPGDLAKRTAQGLVAASTAAPVPAGPDQVEALGLNVEENDVTFDFGGAIDAATAERTADILGPGPGVVERVVDFGQTLIGAPGSGVRAIQRFLTENPVGRQALTTVFMLGEFVVPEICDAAAKAVPGLKETKVVSQVCRVVAIAGLRFVKARIIAEPSQEITSTVIAAALRPYGDAADTVVSGSPLQSDLSASVIAGPTARPVRPDELAVVCGLRRLDCLATADERPVGQHAADTQRNGTPRLLVPDPTGARTQRSSTLRGLATSTGSNRDEFPFELSPQRHDVSIRYIDPASNRSLAAYLGNQLNGLPDGAWFYVRPVA